MIETISRYGFKALVQSPAGGAVSEAFTEKAAREAENFHRQLPGYRPTRLVRLSRLARAWGVGDIFVKDESTRFDLKAFKVLGGSYAVARLMCRKLGMPPEEVDFTLLVSEEAKLRMGRVTFATATDGNHGRGVAWAAEQLGQRAVIYMPRGSARSRVENIRGHGATVEVTDCNYDDTVRLAYRQARENGWHVVQDTAWEGYEEVPVWIMQGYMTLCVEAVDQMAAAGRAPTHVFVQAGVGAFPGAVVGYLANRFREKPPKFICVEPTNAACIFASAAAGDGRPHAVTGELRTIMAGLACGEPNPIAWNILRDFSSGFVSCEDFAAANGMRILGNPLPGDAAVEAGESGAVGIGVLDLLANNPDFSGLREKLEIGPGSSILSFNTEGATDPGNYREIVWHGKCPSPWHAGAATAFEL
ncbi:MAG: diaminopropionate ammonia-lyase [Syntrophobacteraceae bacterium]